MYKKHIILFVIACHLQQACAFTMNLDPFGIKKLLGAEKTEAPSNTVEPAASTRVLGPPTPESLPTNPGQLPPEQVTTNYAYTIPESDAPVTFNVTLNQNTGNASSNAITPANWQQAQQTIFSQMHDLYDASCSWLVKAATWIHHHKYKIIGASLVSTYAFLLYTIRYAKNYVHEPARWSAWQSNLRFSELLAAPQENLAQQLILEIQRRYANPENPTDFLSPLMAFMKDLDAELLQLQQYDALYYWLKKLRFTKIIFMDIEPLKSKEQIERLTYYKKIFQTWAAEYRIEHCRGEMRLKNRDDDSIKPILKQLVTL